MGGEESAPRDSKWRIYFWPAVQSLPWASKIGARVPKVAPGHIEDPPNTPRDRALRIAASSTGFIYYVSVVGITGERKQVPQSIKDNVGWLREQTDLPICIGFGISNPEHIRTLAPMADGLIVGSAIVRRIAALDEQSEAEVLQDVEDYVKTLMVAISGC